MDGIKYNPNGENVNYPNLDDFVQKMKTKVNLKCELPHCCNNIGNGLHNNHLKMDAFVG